MAFPRVTQGRVDQRLTNLSLAIKNKNYIHHDVLPTISGLKNDSGEILVYGVDHLRSYASKRAVWDQSQHRIEYRYDDPKRYQIEYHDLSFYLPDRHREQYEDPADAEDDAVFSLESAKDVIMEDALGSALQSTSILTNNSTPATKWNANGSSPLHDMEVAAESVRASSGYRPNNMILGASVVSALVYHTEFVKRAHGIQKSLSRADCVEIIKAQLGLDKVFVGDARKVTSKEGQGTVTQSDIWGDVCILYYTAERPGLRESSFGYRFELQNKTTKNKRIKIRREPQADKGDLIELEWAYQDKLLDTGLSHLIYDVLA